MVGLALAAQLADSAFSIAIINHTDIHHHLGEQPEPRVSAINIASENMLKDCGAWSELQHQRFKPYTHMQVWEKDSFGKIDFSFDDTAFGHLGHIIENQNVVNALYQTVKSQANLSILNNTSIERLELGEQMALMHLSSGELLSAR